MKKNYTKIIVVLDVSGSMESILNDVIGGYNTFIKSQKELKHGTCDLSLYKFSDSCNTVYENYTIDEVPLLTKKEYVPRGGTALYDAVEKVIDLTGEKLNDLDEKDRPDKVLFIIITDGEENGSYKSTQKVVKSKIERQTNDYKWQFTYIGANQDAWATGASIGTSQAANITYVNNSMGVKNVFRSLSDSTTSYRTSTDSVFCYSDVDIKNQVDAGLNLKNTTNNPLSTTNKKTKTTP